MSKEKKSKLQPKEILRPVLVLFIICLVVSAALAGTNLLTEDKIAQINQQTQEESQQQVLPDAQTFETATTADGTEYVVGKSGEEIVGYVFTTSSNSYGGALEVMTGIKTDDTVTGVNILSIDDTPGLGLNAQNEEFRDQYKQTIPASGSFEVIKNATAGDGQIAALTGATITSNAVTDAVNQAVALYQSVKGGA